MPDGEGVRGVGARFDSGVSGIIDRAVLQAVIEGDDIGNAVSAALSTYKPSWPHHFEFMSHGRVDALLDDNPVERAYRLLIEAIDSVAGEGFAGNRRFRILLAQAESGFADFIGDPLIPRMIRLLRSAEIGDVDSYAQEIGELQRICGSNPDKTRYLLDILLRFNIVIVRGTQDPRDQVFEEMGLVDVGLTKINQIITEGNLSPLEQQDLRLLLYLVQAARYRKSNNVTEELAALVLADSCIEGGLIKGRILARRAELVDDLDDKLWLLSRAEDLLIREVDAQTNDLGKARILQMQADVLGVSVRARNELGKLMDAEMVKCVNLLIDAADLYYQHAKGLGTDTIEAANAFRDEANCLMMALNMNHKIFKTGGGSVLDVDSVLQSLAKAALLSQNGEVMENACDMPAFDKDSNLYKGLVRGGFEFELRRAMRTKKVNQERLYKWLGRLTNLSRLEAETSQTDGKRISLDVDYAKVYVKVVLKLREMRPRIAFNFDGLQEFRQELVKIIETTTDPLEKEVAAQMLERHVMLERLWHGRWCAPNLHVAVLLAPTNGEAARTFYDMLLTTKGVVDRNSRLGQFIEEARRHFEGVRRRAEARAGEERGRAEGRR